MNTQQELQVQQKREVEKKQESTIPARLFVPVADIFETDQALTVVLEMPGVGKDSVDVSVENDVLTIEGRVNFSNYDGLQPLYTEYNVGNYARSFQLSGKIEQDRINDGTGELRRQAIGLVEGLVLVLVAYTMREEGQDEVVRLISARRATRKERTRYEQTRAQDVG